MSVPFAPLGHTVLQVVMKELRLLIHQHTMACMASSEAQNTNAILARHSCSICVTERGIAPRIALHQIV